MENYQTLAYQEANYFIYQVKNSFIQWEVVVVDVTESSIKRPKKTTQILFNPS